MDIIKHTKDLNTFVEISDFIDYLNESLECCVVIEKIRNKKYVLHNARRRSNLPVYNYYEPGTSLSDLLEMQENSKSQKSVV